MHPHTKFGIPTSKNIGDMQGTRSGTDGRTDGRTDSAITICLPKFLWGIKTKLEDLKVLRRSPDFLYNVNLVEGQLQLFVLSYMRMAAILVKQPKQSNE